MLNWTEVGGLSWPCWYLDPVIFEPFVGSTGCVFQIIVLLKNDPTLA